MMRTSRLFTNKPRLLFVAGAALSLTAGSLLGDTSVVSQLNVVGQWPGAESGYARQVAVSGNYAFVADGVAGLQVIDITDPVHPRKRAEWIRGMADGVALAGQYACIAGAVGGFWIVDLQSPLQPVDVGHILIPPDEAAVDCVAVSGNYAYVGANAARTRLAVLDLGDPKQPQVVGQCSGTRSALRMSVSGDYACTTDLDSPIPSFEIFDIHDPTSPQRLGEYLETSNAADYPVAVQIVAGRVFLLSIHSMRIVDVSDPRKPQNISTYRFSPTLATGLIISDSRAYIFGAPMQTLDVTVPVQPKLISVAIGPYFAVGGTVRDNFLYAAAGTYGFWIVPAPSFGPELKMDSSGFHLTFSAESGPTLRLQRSQDLISWENLDTVTATGQSQEATDTEALNTPHQFYRLRTVE